MSSKRYAFLLVDLQQDFLSRQGLNPVAGVLLANIARWLHWFRDNNQAVFHIHTQVSADGSDAMPHWRKAPLIPCRVGTPGVCPPSRLAPLAGESVLVKRGYNPFNGTDLDEQLRKVAPDRLIVAGLYGHACVRSTVLEAYERGYQVSVAADAIGSYDLLHAEISREFIEDRAATYLSFGEWLNSAVEHGTSPRSSAGALPAAWIDGRWFEADATGHAYEHHQPTNGQFLYRVNDASAKQIDQAVRVAHCAAHDWAKTAVQQRCALLRSWYSNLLSARDSLISELVQEIAKPVSQAQEEYERMLCHLGDAIGLTERLQEPVAAEVEVRHRPHGVVAVVTPWNNPLAIAMGKLSSAIACGNSVLWKPAPECAQVSQHLLQVLARSDMPRGLIGLLQGGYRVAEQLVRQPLVAAVALTGSVATGRRVALSCQHRNIPLQAELGGKQCLFDLVGC